MKILYFLKQTKTGRNISATLCYQEINFLINIKFNNICIIELYFVLLYSVQYS